jgi:Xaa-Pro aminopeptidase
MVFTLEPGAYLPGEIGIRIEDTVVLEAAGARRLTHAARELVVL